MNALIEQMIAECRDARTRLVATWAADMLLLAAQLRHTGRGGSSDEPLDLSALLTPKERKLFEELVDAADQP